MTPSVTELSADAPVERLAGVGPALGRTLREAGLATLGDLVWLLPRNWDDRDRAVSVSEAVARAPGRNHLVVRGTVRRAGFVPGRRGRGALRVEVEDEQGARLTAWWFFRAHGLLSRAKVGAPCLLVGRVVPASRGAGAMMAHPDLWLDEPGAERVVPRYPKLNGVGGERLRRFVRGALEALAGALPDPVPEAIARREGFAPFAELLQRLHQPEMAPSPGELRAARERLAWAEAFARAWLRLGRRGVAEARALPLPRADAAVARLSDALGFSWTGAQRRAIDEIAADLAQPKPMRRLLLGDVGSGKTGVALAAAAQAAAAGAQTVIFAPTTALADQYATTAECLRTAVGARVAVLTGATRAAERRELVAALQGGEIDVLIGTHALLGDGLVLPRLGLAIVDEQQRLGVAQRLAVASGGGETEPHLLTLSATPIPRTLALALRGEIAQSELTELPPGRQPIATQRVARSAWSRDVLPNILENAARGEGTFVVCPRIDADDDDDDGPSAAERFAELKQELGSAAVLAHSRRSLEDRRSAIARFRTGEAQVLVGTSVVEVGIDVPHATLMVVDGAEHFGLSQLHQLRGRVGRSERPSRCLLVHDEPVSELAEARLDALVRTQRGSEVARADLEQRGAGELDGARQSGDSGLLFLEGFSDAPWLERIAADARELLAADPGLERPEHRALGAFVGRLPERLGVREEAG